MSFRLITHRLYLVLILVLFSIPYPSQAASRSEIRKGEQLYNQNCSVCHQADAIGKPGFAPSLRSKEFLSIVSNQFLLRTIRDGRMGTGMPPFGHLGRRNVEAIVTYLRSFASLPSRAALIDRQPRAKGNIQRGRQRYNEICVTCHGPKGNGYVAGGTGTAIGKAGFLTKVSDGFIRTTVKEGRSNTRMYGFQGPEALADLSNSEIDDIIVYLRTVPSR